MGQVTQGHVASSYHVGVPDPGHRTAKATPLGDEGVRPGASSGWGPGPIPGQEYE